MSIVVLQLPVVKRQIATRPTACPYCQGETFQRWGAVKKPVRDPRLRSVKVYRYRCCHCRPTFRHYPAGVDRADQTARLRKLAAICWTLGFSYRSLAAVFAAFGVQLSRMTAWRDVQAQADGLKQRRQWQPVRVLGLDGAYVRGWGGTQPVLVAVDLGTGQPVALGYVNERDPQALRRWLAPLEGSRRLFELWKQVPPQRPGRDDPLEPLDRLRSLLLRLSEHWDSYRVFDWDKDVPWTNNGTEQVIGRMKMRSRTVRGYKTPAGLLSGLWVTGSGMC